MVSSLAKWSVCTVLVGLTGYIYLRSGRLWIRETEAALNQGRGERQLFLNSGGSISVMDKELDIPDPMEKTVKRINMIKDVCGDLCDTSKEIKPGEFMGSVTAKVYIYEKSCF